MNLHRFYLLGWLVALSLQLNAQCVQSFKVLHYTETTGYDHNTRSSSKNMFEGMGLLENFEVVTDNSGDQFSSLDSLAQYAAVIFSNTSGNSGLDSTQRENFKAYMLNGGGFMGIHAAGDAYRHTTANGNNTGVWDWYPENLTGASVRIGPSHTSWSHVDTLSKVSPVHPSLNNIPDPWIKQEEYYYWEGGYLDTTFSPILGVTSTGTNYYDIPRMMAQIKELPGGGRTFYTALGHAPVNYTSDTIFQRLILDALLWVAEPNLPSSLEAMVEVNQLPCLATGTASVVSLDSTQMLSYTWSTGDTTSSVASLAPGIYTVTISNSAGCTKVDSVEIQSGSEISPQLSVLNEISCFNGANGSIGVVLPGGIGNYDILWSTGDTTELISGLGAGSFSVIISDSAGCTGQDTILLQAPPQLSATATVTNAIDCFGQTGSASVVSAGGTGTKTILWSHGSTIANPGNLSAGTYSVTITDANGCTATDSITLTNPPQLSITATVVNAIDCFGQTGTASVTSTGGTGTKTILWSHGSTVANPGNLSAGTYSVTITDANGCIATDNITLTNPPQLSATATVVNPIDCFGQTGTASVTSAGGTGTKTILWSHGSTVANPGNLSAGTYSVTITDANGCIATDNITLTNPPQLSATATVGNPIDCFGQTGTASVVSTGGTGTKTILWSHGSTVANPGNLSAGTYNVTITDANGCTATDNITLNQPPALLSAISMVQPVDCSNKGGEVSLAISGGSPSYTIQWENGDTTLVRDSLAAGSYVVLVTDANGCVLSDTIVLPGNTPILTSFATGSDILCFGDSTGEITLQISGGQTPYLITWDDGDTSLVKTGLGAGSFSVLVEDMMGCLAKDSITITSPAELVPAIGLIQPISCFGDGSAVVEVSVAGGTAPFRYVWANGDSTTVLTKLGSGTVTVSVNDSAGCVANGELFIPQPDSLFSSIEMIADSSCTIPAGSITITPQGGTTPYQAALTSVGTGGTQTDSTGTLAFVGLEQGAYLLQITDANGCELVDSVLVEDACEQKDRLEDMMGMESWIISLSPDKKFITVDIAFLRPEPAVITVRDIHGKLIAEMQFPEGRNIHEQIQASSLARGVYLIQITTKDASASRKLVLR